MKTCAAFTYLTGLIGQLNIFNYIQIFFAIFLLLLCFDLLRYLGRITVTLDTINRSLAEITSRVTKIELYAQDISKPAPAPVKTGTTADGEIKTKPMP